MNTKQTNKEEDDELIQLTPYGLLSHEFSDSTARRVLDVLELYMRRGNLGIAIEDNRLQFVKLTPVNRTEN